MNHYKYLEQICNRFPELLKLKCDIYVNQVVVKVLDCEDKVIAEKLMDVEGEFESEKQIELMKDNCAFDITCTMFLFSANNIRKNMKQKVLQTQSKLN